MLLHFLLDLPGQYEKCGTSGSEGCKCRGVGMIATLYFMHSNSGLPVNYIAHFQCIGLM